MKNYYTILSIAENAASEEIKIAYRLNAKRYHPDLNPGNESYQKRFLEIKDAYEILSNPEARARYDHELAEYRKKSGADQKARAEEVLVKSARPKTAGFEQSFGRTAAPPPPNGRTQAPPPPRKEESTEAQIAQLKRSHADILQKMQEQHEVQLELMRVSAHEEFLKYKLAAKQRFEAFKKRVLAEREHIRSRYNAAVSGFARKLKRYKQNIKRSVYHAGLKEGIKSGQDSAKRTIEELKAVASGKTADAGRGARIEDLKLELSLIQEKNTELAREIELLERLSVAESKDLSKTEQLAEIAADEETARSLALECDALKIKLQEYESEIERLNDEVLRLEGALAIWRAAGADGVVTDEEFEQIQNYEDEQLEKSKGTLYGVLGLYLNALPEEIDRAYDKLSRRYSGKDEYLERFMAINEAYEVLSDPKLKTAYDASIGNETEL